MAKVYRGTQAKSQFVDTSDVFEKVQTDIALGELARETKRQKWKDDYEAVRKEQQDIESTGSAQFNNFVGNWSGAIQDQALTLKNGLESGNISSKDYTSNWGNLKSSNDELISSQKTYKARADKVYEEFNNGTGSLANVQALNAYNQKMNLKGLQAVTNENGGIDLFDKDSKKIINTFGLSNLTNVNVQKFDRAAAAKTLVDQFGKKITSVDGRTITTVEIGGMKYDLQDPNTPAGKDMNKAIQDSAMSSLLAGNNMASYLIDGNLGYTLDGDPNDPKTLIVKDDGTIDIPDAAQAVAVEAFTKDIRNALGFSDIQKDKTKSDYQKDYLAYLNKKGLQDSRENEQEYVQYRSNRNQTVRQDGNIGSTKNSIRTLEEPFTKDNRENTTESIKNVFDKNDAFPGFDSRDVEVSYNERETEVTGYKTSSAGVGAPGQRSPVTEVKTEESVTLDVPKLQDAPITLPPSKNNRYLDNYIAALDDANQEKRKLTSEDYLKIFDGDQKLLEQYNPQLDLNATTTGGGEGDPIFNKK